jgi:hypothetical protein
MLSAVQFHSYVRIGTQKVDLELSEPVECNRQGRVERETAPSFRQRLQSPKQKRFRGAPGTVRALGVWEHGPGGMHEQRRKWCVDAISNEPSHAARVITLPDRIRR